MPKATKPRATKPKATKPKATRHRFVSVTAERWAKACLLISEGHHKTLAFRATGISKPMLYRYLQFAAAEAEREPDGIHAKRAKQLDQAEASEGLMLETLGLKHAKAGSWAATEFFLKRRHADEYGEDGIQNFPSIVELFVDTIEAIKDGALQHQEVAESLGDDLAARLFKSIGIDVGTQETEQAGGSAPGKSGKD